MGDFQDNYYGFIEPDENADRCEDCEEIGCRKTPLSDFGGEMRCDGCIESMHVHHYCYAPAEGKCCKCEEYAWYLKTRFKGGLMGNEKIAVPTPPIELPVTYAERDGKIVLFDVHMQPFAQFSNREQAKHAVAAMNAVEGLSDHALLDGAVQANTKAAKAAYDYVFDCGDFDGAEARALVYDNLQQLLHEAKNKAHES